MVRRRQPPVGAVGRRERDELPDQQRGEGGGTADGDRGRGGGLRRHPALPHPGVPGAPPRRERARVSQGLVVIPTDSATAEQRAKYEEYAAKRLPRTTEPQGPGRLLFAPDLVGTSAEIAGRLHAHAAFREIDEVAFALPFTFDHEDYVQILTDIATKLGPELGWRPAA